MTFQLVPRPHIPKGFYRTRTRDYNTRNGDLETFQEVKGMYYINGLEYLGRNVKIRGREMQGVEAKRFVTIKKTDKMPNREDVSKWAEEWKSQKNSKLKRVWVMQIEGNKWKKVMDVISL